MTPNFIDEVSARWPLDIQDAHLFATRENQIHKLTTTDGKQYALRIHRLGYSSTAELNSELAFMKSLSENSLCVPTPLLSLNKNLVEEIDEYQLDVLSWLDGTPMGKTGVPLALTDRPSVFNLLGVTLAKLHSISDNWQTPEGFVRRRWDAAGLVGDKPIWGEFWNNPYLTLPQQKLLIAARTKANVILNNHAHEFDQGLIHADPVRENILIEGESLHLIDFDDSGYGFRLLDIATALIKNEMEPDYEVLKNHLIEGYQSVRSLDTKYLDLFIALRSFTYVGWIINRINEVGGNERNERFIKDAVSKAQKLVENDYQR